MRKEVVFTVSLLLIVTICLIALGIQELSWAANKGKGVFILFLAIIPVWIGIAAIKEIMANRK